MASFAKPENALKRAEELINVGQKQDALQTLHDLFTSRRHRAWQKPLERSMFKYIELCVDLRRGRFAKDGLIQYRIICQQVNVSSLEEVIKHFMHLSTERAEQARTQAQALEEALDVEDLEADKRPEDLMLSYVSGEKGKDRSDRELVTPWFKFLWETYRTVLEILRNNSKLEALYAMTAHRAFQFCKQYKRTTEFRRLCEIIRNHLANLNKYRDQRDRPDLSAPESLQLYVDTRFEQLKVATELELWQEAFRSIEDIHGLMCMVKKTPKSSLMAVYYAKLTEIFWISSSHLYHAYAWFKLFLLQKSFNKNLSQKDLQLIASSVLLAALSVNPYDHTRSASHMDIENEKERNLRMANLIGFNLETKLEGKEVLSRSSLLSELVAKGVLSCVTQEVKDLYHLLEHDFFPLDLASKVQPLLNKISKFGGKLLSAPSVPEVQLSQYVPTMERLTTLRLLQQVSQVYQIMRIESLSRMIPFFDFAIVEKISVDAVKHNFVALKVDHMKGGVIFDNMGLESEILRGHLTNLAETLNEARAMIYPPARNVSKLGELLPSLAEIVDKEHKRLLARKSLIEKRKEEEERKLLEKERLEESKRIELLKITEEAERKRLASEYEERKNERIRREIEERELAEAQALLQEASHRIKWKGKKPAIEGEKLTKQSVMELTLSEQLRERQEMEKKLQKLAKTMDYLERAKREEAAPLVEAAYQQRLVEERVLHECEQQMEEDSVSCNVATTQWFGSDSSTPVDVEERESRPTFSSTHTQNPTSSIPPIPKKSKKAHSNRSIAWDNFTKVEPIDPDDPKAKCNWCGKEYKCHYKNGTSSMRTHLFNCSKSPFFAPKNASSSKRDVEGKVCSPQVLLNFDAEQLRVSTAKFFIRCELPFRLVENEGFIDYVAALEPRFTLPSRITLKRDCIKLYNEEKIQLKNLLYGQRICLTTDTWTSVQNLNYMCITAHFIDCHWRLHKKILKFCQIPNHKGDTIGRVLESALYEFGVDKILTITVDNACSNDVAVDYIKRIMKDNSRTVLGGEHLHMRCAAHILNMVVKEGLEENSNLVTRIRDAVKYVKSSPSRFAKFKACVAKENISGRMVCLDVSTRWNSTYLMLSTAEQHKQAFEQLVYMDENFKNPPTADDWKIARVFIDVLKVFYDVTLNISGSLYVTSNIYFEQLCIIEDSLNEMILSTDNIISFMGASMRLKYDKYWGNTDKFNLIIYIGFLLDPRYKRMGMKCWLTTCKGPTEAEAIEKKVKLLLERLIEQYNTFRVTSGGGSNVAQGRLHTTSRGSYDVPTPPTNKLRMIFNQYLEEQGGMEFKSELKRYLSEACVKDSLGFDILDWWRVNAANYPVLAELARDVLATPISTVASESAFSIGGRVLDPFRSSLSPETVEALICTQNWLRTKPLDLEELQEYVQMMDLEDDDIDEISTEVAVSLPSHS